MKKLIITILIAVMIPVIALADVDLASMSFEELKALQKAINEEIVKRPEWKEVVVPGGTWIVGSDIPVGVYSINPTKEGGYVRVYNEKDSLIVSQGIRSGDRSIGKIELLNGYTVEISRGSVIFAPSIGLGF